jgi:hypothetical protein
MQREGGERRRRRRRSHSKVEQCVHKTNISNSEKRERESVFIIL